MQQNVVLDSSVYSAYFFLGSASTHDSGYTRPLGLYKADDLKTFLIALSQGYFKCSDRSFVFIN